MSAPVSRDEFASTVDRLIAANAEDKIEVLNALRVGFEGINARLNTLNGRTNKHGEDIATLYERTTKDTLARVGAVIGAILGGLAAAWTALKS